MNKKDIELIEKSGFELRDTKKFGELLGYGKCAMNIHKVGDNLAEYKQLFGLGCNLKSLDTKYYFDLFVKINRLLQGSKYHISLRYMDYKRITDYKRLTVKHQ